MPQTDSPLRYPGGKSSILKMVSEIISHNGYNLGNYVEPYAGGCGLALSLLFKGYVHELYLNDLDRSIYSFWNQALNNTDDFIDKINETPITLEEWHKQREVQLNKETADEVDLGFSSFFLNRTNRSGVIQKAGVIGGIEQKGKYKIDCRFNKKGLIQKLERIKKYSHRIHFYNYDALDFIDETNSNLPDNTFYCVDPPYYNKGSTLYTNFYNPQDHACIAKKLSELNKAWILTYDNAPEISELYQSFPQYNFNLNYSAQVKRVGTELLITKDSVKIPEDLNVAKAA